MSPPKPAVLITGAGTGIGAATAVHFSNQGYPIILSGRRLEKLEEVAKNLSSPNLVISEDLSSDLGTRRLIEGALKKMDVGILINNAGIFERGPFLNSTDETWHKIFEINVMGPVRLCRAILPHFKKRQGGVIVNVASTAGLRPVPGMSPYSTSKGALISFSQGLALELASEKIRVHSVCPGVIETPIHFDDKMDESDKKRKREEWAKMHPLGRGGKPEDVAYGIYSLCATGSEWMTGAILTVDGGISLT